MSNVHTYYDPSVIPLHWIFHEPDALHALHAIQLQRVRERAFTDNERPVGARLSIDDPVRRVKAIFDPFWRVHIDDGIGERGYLCEDLLEICVISNDTGPYRHGTYQAQVEIPWGPTGQGWSSAFDFNVSGSASGSRVVSCKSSAKAPVDVLVPSAANVAQERRMLALAGSPAGTPFDVWMVHPGMLAARGPFTHLLEQQHIDDALAEAEAVANAWRFFVQLDLTPEQLRDHPVWNSPAEWRERWGLVSTSGAFHYRSLDASDAIEARVEAFLHARREAADANAAADAAKRAIRRHVDEQLDQARLRGQSAKSVSAYSADAVVTFTVDARGAMRVTERPHPGADTASAD